jgi:hypothetical protein
MPVTPDFYLSHQWLRELKRGGQRTICGVYFRIPDDESVWVGHYNRNQRALSAAEAVDLIMTSEAAEGYEVLVPRAIAPGEIQRVRTLPQVVGWRYQPGAHELSTCMCVVCNPPGTINSRRKGDAWEARQV